MQKDNQRRLLLLLKLLYEQTDETHFVSGADILRYWEDAGIRANRKNVYGDIRLLLDAGHDIIRVKSKQNRYFIGSRIFELPELKLLADAVASSHLVTEKKSAALLQKLGRLTSVHNAGHLNRPVYMEGTTKPDNEAIYYGIDAILRHLLQREEPARGDVLAEIPFPAVHLGIGCVHFLCDRHVHTIHGDDVGDDISVLVLDPSVIAIFLPFFHMCGFRSQIF